MATRALSNGVTATASSRRFSMSSAARDANTFIFAGPIISPRFFKSPRTWFSRSRLILNEQSSADEESLDRVTVEVFDAHFLIPSTLHDARDSYGIVAVALVDLHSQGRLCVPGVDADDGRLELVQLGP